MKQIELGQSVKYFDYLDGERFGRIVAMEPYPYDPTLAWIYIEDEESEYNNKFDVINGVQICYAELRISTEVYIDN